MHREGAYNFRRVIIDRQNGEGDTTMFELLFDKEPQPYRTLGGKNVPTLCCLNMVGRKECRGKECTPHSLLPL